jgi:hypothetical protein
MRAFLLHLRWLREQTADDALAGIPDQKLRQFAAEAHTRNAADLSRMTEAKRLTLIAALSHPARRGRARRGGRDVRATAVHAAAAPTDEASDS